MKTTESSRMPPKKNAGEKNAGEKKAPERKKLPTKRRGGGAQDDDDSVDSRGNIRGLIAYDGDTSEESYDSEDETTEASELTPKQLREIRKSGRDAAKKTRRGFLPRKKVEPEESPKRRAEEPKRRRKQESEDEEDEEDEDYDEEYDEDEEYEEGSHKNELIISFGGGEEPDNRMIPKRHNMKKESADVKKFVTLLTKQQEEGGIDDQIEEFKRQTPDKQKTILTALDRTTTVNPEKQSMMFKILSMNISPEVQAMVLARYNTLQNMDPGSGEYFKGRAWLEKFSALPLGIYREIPAKLSDGTESCGVFMEKARRCLNESIYGQQEAKIQILQFIASKITNPSAGGLSLLLAGPPGIGKTSLIKNGIAQALNWPFQFISLGGDSDASTYTGHQVVYEGSHCGKIVNSLIAAKSMSMVMMFDELDKISATPKGEEVQNLLVHLTDSVQNSEFEDKYLSGIPLDLSKIMFSFSANDLVKIDKILLDRMVVIQLEGYSKKDKIAIAENFLLPTALKDVTLEEKVSLSHDVLEHIINEYAAEEKGVRELKRCIEAITQKINMLRILNTKDLPFYIADFQLPFIIKKAHVDLFLKKKKSDMDESARRMYT